ncbi:hypothetical protein [Granulicoccus phenolivorans]|uniref:hypothetical protein n=1 Tax=Granulicoccus phenolivorans TaxID=266854 RepID=UPI0003FD36F4|nr:hypothetical protein [Granulicoccus phenolivorans]
MSAVGASPVARLARRQRLTELVLEGRTEESLPLWREELDDGGLPWAQQLVDRALTEADLTIAGRYANILARLRWGDAARADDERPAPSHPPNIAKLRHDSEQFLFLQRRGILGEEMTPIIGEYQRLMAQLETQGLEARLPFDSDGFRGIRDAYNRIFHIRDTPRISRALSDSWDPPAVEDEYLDHAPGIVVIDNFLQPEALEAVRDFCLESTVWSGNRYALGRLGAFFQDGFNAPLLLQIAEELREALPRVIGERYPLRQLWGFKSGPELPPDATTHADFAAVNVNFWTTPDAANLAPGSGGLVVYDIDAPLSWGFDTYNGRTDVIKPFLRDKHSIARVVPYRQNRAILFNSDLFHATGKVHFKPGFENLRVNVTMLYGQREDEVHHRQLSGPEVPLRSGGLRPAWRSESWARARR